MYRKVGYPLLLYWSVETKAEVSLFFVGFSEEGKHGDRGKTQQMFPKPLHHRAKRLRYHQQNEVRNWDVTLASPDSSGQHVWSLIYIIINTQVKTTHMLTLTADYWGGKRHWQCNWFISQLHPAHQSFTASRTTTPPEKKRGPSNVRLSRTRSYFPLRRLRHMRHSL